jgi:hypothetical protein
MNTLKSLIALAAAFAALNVFAADNSGAKVGQPAPQFSTTDINGQAVKLEDFKGKIVVLEWVNPECPFVKRHYESGNMPALQKEATADGVVWLSINSGHKGAQGDFEPAQVKEWMRKHNNAATAYIRDSDGKIGKLYGAKTTPHMYVINKDGVLVYNGAIDNDRRNHANAENYVRAAIAAVKSGNSVAKSTSEPYGCGVKYN